MPDVLTNFTDCVSVDSVCDYQIAHRHIFWNAIDLKLV